MTIDLTKELAHLVSFNTVTNAREITRPSSDCPQYIKTRLDEMGFITELLESNGVITALGRKGQGRFKILFLAHYDVVPPGEGWNTDPFSMKIDGDRAYGRGTCDDKGNIASLLGLAEMLQETELPCMTMIATTGDEEIGGRNGAKYLREYLISQGLFPDFVVIADGINQVVIHRRRNAMPVEIKARQKKSILTGRIDTIRFKTETFGSESRHSAYMRPGVDRHAMLTACKYLELNAHSVVSDARGAFVKSNVVPDWVELDIIHPDESGTELEYDETLTGLFRSLLPLSQAPFPTEYSDFGTIVSPNLLSLEDDLWYLYLDVRAMTNDSEPIEKAFKRALEGRAEIFTLKASAGAGYVNSDPDSHLIKAAEWALQKEKIQYKLIEGYGASDSRYFADSALVFDFGPVGDNLHGPNEWVSLSSISENTKFYYSLIDVLIRKPDSI